MNLQEVFDIVVPHARKQGVQSMKRLDNGAEVCAYRGNNNTKCFIGALIPDNRYLPEMECKVVSGLINCYPDEVGTLIGEIPITDLTDLQRIHDDFEPHMWESMLAKYAAANGLVMPDAKQD